MTCENFDEFTDAQRRHGFPHKQGIALSSHNVAGAEDRRVLNDNLKNIACLTEYLRDTVDQLNATPVLQTLPQFTRVGTKLQAPAWMTETEGPLFPRLFENDLYRGNLPSLPSSRFSVLFSTDHASVTGRIGRCDFDDIENDTWTDSGSAIIAATPQLETPHPVYDAANNRVNVFCHDGQSTTLYGTQSSRLRSSTTLASGSFTDHGQITGEGQHTGYAQSWFEDGVWKMLTTLYGGKISDLAFWESSDPTSFGTDFKFLSSAWMHLIGEGKTLKGRFLFDWGGFRYFVGALTTHPSDTINASAYIIFPIDKETWEPLTTEYQTLLTPGSGDDAVLHNSMSMYEIDGTLYIIYVGRNAGETVNSLMLAKSVPDTVAPATSFNHPTIKTSDPTTLFTWDSANDPLPAGITTVVVNGSNASNQSVSNYYRAQTGSGSTQGLILQGTTGYDPRNYDIIGFKLTGVRLNPTADQTKVNWQYGWRDNPQSATHGFALYWDGGSWLDGRLIETNSGSATSTTTYCMPYGFSTVSPWLRNYKFDLELLWLDAGTKIALLVDEQLVFLRSVSANISLATLKPYIRVTSQTTPFPMFYLEFESWSVATY